MPSYVVLDPGEVTPDHSADTTVEKVDYKRLRGGADGQRIALSDAETLCATRLDINNRKALVRPNFDR